MKKRKTETKIVCVPSKEPEIVFVYNTDSGVLQSITDTAHRILSPKSFQCNLLKITRPAVTPRRSWKLFLKSLPLPAETLCRDQYNKKFCTNETALPGIFLIDENGPSVLVPFKKINKIHTIKELSELVNKALKNYKHAQKNSKKTKKKSKKRKKKQ